MTIWQKSCNKFILLNSLEGNESKDYFLFANPECLLAHIRMMKHHQQIREKLTFEERAAAPVASRAEV